MRKLGLRVLAKLDALVDWFVPPEIAANREARRQARIFLFSHICGPFVGNVVPAAIFLFDPNPSWDIAVLAGSITAFWIFPFVLRAGARYDTLVLVSVQNLIFCILWSCYFYGGVVSPTLAWVVTIPLLAFFYIGPATKLRSHMLVLFAVNLVAAVPVFRYGPQVANNLPTAAVQGLGIVSTVAASLYVSMMAFYYAKVLASGAEFENETKRHLATAAKLRAATIEAERAGAAKSEFLAKMSHELRTPLNAIIGYSEMLLEDAAAEGDTATVADLSRIHGSGRYLLRLLNQVLDLSKIEAGRMELFVEEVDVGAIVASVAAGYRDAVEAGGNAFDMSVQGDLGTIRTDRSKLQQALGHLLDNAAKFTEDGGVAVMVERRAGPAGEEVVVAVRDTGIGIEGARLSELFEQFTVVDDSSASKYGGTGLGLALSRKLCRLMGGDVTAESELGLGSCFTLRLPVGPARTATQTAAGEQMAPAGLPRAA